MPLAILCSSGTTGLPKGVCLSHSQVTYQLSNFLPLNAQDFLLSFSSPYWVSGFLSLCLAPLHCATRIVTTEPFSSKLLLTLIEKYRVSLYIGAPNQYQLMLLDPDVHITDLSSVRIFIIGGSLVTNNLKVNVEKVMPDAHVVPFYGMTEFVGLCSSTYKIEPSEKDGCVGQLVGNMQGKIISESGEELESNEIGEIFLKNEFPFLGYWDNDEATSSTLSSDGWVATGDHGFFDDTGRLHITGRLKDMLKYMGYQIAPGELEAIIEKLEGVIVVCVVGISDPVYGDLAAAAIIKHPDSDLTEEEVVEAVAERVSVYKQLRGGAYFLESLPRTVSGKIRAREVKEILTELYNERNESQE